MVLGIAERFGQSPFDVLRWPADILRLLNIEALGRDDETDTS